jgi:hypothetical protein
VTNKNFVSKSGRRRVGARRKRLTYNIDETCTTVETNIPPKKKKKEEVGSNFKCKYSGKGKPGSEVFNDKWGLTLKMGGGEEEKSGPRTVLSASRRTKS